MPVVSRTDSGIGAVPTGTRITLRVEPVPAGHTVRWEHNTQEVATTPTHEFVVDEDTAGKYMVTVTNPASKAEEKAQAEISLQDPKPFFDPTFAKYAAVVIVIASATAIGSGTFRLWEIDKRDWTGASANLMFAASLTLPVLVLGGLALAVGLFMASVEWRGRFQPPPKPQAAPVKASAVDIAVEKVIEAIGKLQGAALVLVIGAVLLLGSIWGVASSAAGSPTPSPSSSATSGTGATGVTGGRP